MSVMCSTLLCSSGVWVPMPALLTSSVMLASLRSFSSTWASDAAWRDRLPALRRCGRSRW
jgi:hypothetical protein